ncbi:helix-turn-helix transcriptional regulator [Neorhizobium sp. AL 9.2.2]|uniref:helix-turn-helix transcriptional regulator n=1 Tax=Neorhizobium sp. AL 9.2.2 TaxID=2712894 RepID=UPI001571F833|nr:helix-turn-helix transcriptional regulator [Neorhizobium sp. AL 9.2.2]NSY16294.1 helix-turn-helix transcriptional regulator [Neorhizobium sp. AL 9.2.2]
MTSYQNPHAALRVGQIIETHLTRLEMSYRDLADRLGVKDTKIIYFVTGRHYFPVQFARPTADALGIDQGELIHFVLLQYFPRAEVDAIWEAIAMHVLGQQAPSEGGAEDEEKEAQNTKRKKRKKRKKSR